MGRVWGGGKKAKIRMEACFLFKVQGSRFKVKTALKNSKFQVETSAKSHFLSS
jgi:hypothetical protein